MKSVKAGLHDRIFLTDPSIFILGHSVNLKAL